jgi:hypothetical protein
MLNGRNLIVDTFSEVYQLLKPWITSDFWDLAQHDVVPNSYYVIGRKQFVENRDYIVDKFVSNPDITVIFDNAAEGSWTLVSQLQALNLNELALSKKLLLIGGGSMSQEYNYVEYDHFLIEILNYEENVAAAQSTDLIFDKQNKPYDFLFLNGRSRPHRKYLYERFKKSGRLDRALWTMLDSRPCPNRYFELYEDGVNLMSTVSDLKYLDSQYEFSFYRDSQVSHGPLERTFVKHELFKNQWGEIYLEPAPYIDTYFSLVTETIFAESTHSFRTEKIAKPIMMGHPWICVANRNFYRDIRNLGFKTFGHLIDETFDQEDDNQKRIDRIFDVVSDLCDQDLGSFLAAARDTCKYNQQHLIELAPRLKQQFPTEFIEMLRSHG